MLSGRAWACLQEQRSLEQLHARGVRPASAAEWMVTKPDVKLNVMEDRGLWILDAQGRCLGRVRSAAAWSYVAQGIRGVANVFGDLRSDGSPRVVILERDLTEEQAAELQRSLGLELLEAHSDAASVYATVSKMLGDRVPAEVSNRALDHITQWLAVVCDLDGDRDLAALYQAVQDLEHEWQHTGFRPSVGFGSDRTFRRGLIAAVTHLELGQLYGYSPARQAVLTQIYSRYTWLRDLPEAKRPRMVAQGVYRRRMAELAHRPAPDPLLAFAVEEARGGRLQGGSRMARKGGSTASTADAQAGQSVQ